MDVIKKPAKLEFHCRESLPHSHPARCSPLGWQVMTWEHESNDTGDIIETPYLVETQPAALGDIISSAHAGPDPTTGQFLIYMSFTSEGAKIMGDLTGELVTNHDPMAIVLDGKLSSAPAVQSVITNNGEITGDFTQKQAVDLANVLNNPLDKALRLDEMTEVGPTLAAGGARQLHQGGVAGHAAGGDFHVRDLFARRVPVRHHADAQRRA